MRRPRRRSGCVVLQSCGTQPNATQPDPTQPNPTRPDPTQPNPTQPDLVSAPSVATEPSTMIEKIECDRDEPAFISVAPVARFDLCKACAVQHASCKLRHATCKRQHAAHSHNRAVAAHSVCAWWMLLLCSATPAALAHFLDLCRRRDLRNKQTNRIPRPVGRPVAKRTEARRSACYRLQG
jgi:hypothetical protein